VNAVPAGVFAYAGVRMLIASQARWIDGDNPRIYGRVRRATVMPSPSRRESMNRSAAPLLIALCATLAGCADMAAREVEHLQAGLAALPSRCALGNATEAAEAWIAAPQAGSAPGFASSWLFTFNEPVRVDAFRAALSPRALHNLDKVETRDAQGNWSVAWTGGQGGVPAGCDAVTISQAFAAGRRDITAMRIVLHPVFGAMTLTNVGVRKAG